MDASEAGDGNLEIHVVAEGDSVPNYVKQETDTLFRVTFTPQRACIHQVQIRFNGEPVPGTLRLLLWRVWWTWGGGMGGAWLQEWMQGWKEGNVFFNNTLNTFYLRLYGVKHMVKDHSDSERGNPLLPHGLLFPISSKGSFICIIPQTG